MCTKNVVNLRILFLRILSHKNGPPKLQFEDSALTHESIFVHFVVESDFEHYAHKSDFASSTGKSEFMHACSTCVAKKWCAALKQNLADKSELTHQ